MPPSVTTATREPAQRGVDELGRTALLVALEVGDHPAAELDAQIAGQAVQPAGVLGRDDVGGRRVPAPAGPTRPSALPSGAPNRMITPSAGVHDLAP